MKFNSFKNKIPFLPNNGEMGELIQQKDWCKTPLGDPETWSQSLRTTLSIILNSKFPMFLFWGPELICFYNNAFRPSLGNDGKHPAILGSRADEYWEEIWSDIKPLIDNVFASGEASWSEDQLLPFYRNGIMEDIYWTFSNSPVYDESGKPGGVLVTCVETTKQVIALEKLSESQEKLNFAINAANLGTWDLNPVTNRFIYNEQLRNWFGLSYSYEIDAPLAINSIAERDQQRTIDSMAAAMAPGSDGNYEIQHTVISPLDGTERIILAKGKALFDENGIVYRFSGTGQDITKEFSHRKNEEEKNLFNKVILESNPDCVKIIDTDGKISYMNENGVCVLEGESKSYFIDRKWESMWGLEEEVIVHNAVERAFAGEKINFQASAITVKGNLKWWDVIVSALPDESGVIKDLLAVSRDITGIKNAEKCLEESEEQLRFALEGGNLGYFDSFPQTGELNWSNKAKDFFGLAPNAEVNLEVYKKLIHPDDYENAQNVMIEALQNNKSDLYENEFRTSHEKMRWLKVIGKIKHNEIGVPVRVTGVIQDITDEKLADINIKESEERFRTLAETLPQLIWITNEKGEFEFMSKRWEEYLGIQIKTFEEWKSMVHPNDFESIKNDWFNGLLKGKVNKYDIRLKGKDQEYRWFTVNGEPVFNTENKIIKWVGAFTDIHTEKSFLQELEKQVNERTKELSVAKDNLTNKNDELEKMNKELESFAYVSSHDLQEPLRKIQTFSNRILEKENDNLSETGKEYLRRMRLAGERMQQLIQDLLAYSRTKTTDRKFESVNLDKILADIKDDLKDEIKQKNVIINTDETCSLYVKIIPFQFRQLIYNLISNSIKFSKTDVQPTIKLICDISEGSRMNHKNLTPNQKYYHIEISDNGIGFKPDYKEKIFEIFQRLHGREEYTGTGIGLAIVKKIIENHNGFIFANGEVGVGATFDIYIPVK